MIANLNKQYPSLDRKYRDRLYQALRTRDVEGDRIGEVLAEVDNHVTETGEDPRVAFGLPREYAARIAAETGVGGASPVRIMGRLPMILILVLSLVGSGLVVHALRDGARTAFTAADVASLPVIAIGVAGLVALLMYASRLLGVWARVGVRIAAVVVLMGAFTVTTRLEEGLADTPPVVEMPQWAAFGGAAACLLPVLGILIVSFRRAWPVDPR